MHITVLLNKKPKLKICKNRKIVKEQAQFSACMHFKLLIYFLCLSAKTLDGRAQIKFLSGYNPYELYRVCVPL